MILGAAASQDHLFRGVWGAGAPPGETKRLIFASLIVTELLAWSIPREIALAGLAAGRPLTGAGSAASSSAGRSSGRRSEATSHYGVCEVSAHRNPMNLQCLGLWLSPDRMNLYSLVTVVAPTII